MIDVSDKMLYNEMKAEQSFLALINATVSHELRNPLTSLNAQILAMDMFFHKFKAIINKSQTFSQS